MSVPDAPMNPGFDMDSISAEARRSTCLKRVVVCVLHHPDATQPAVIASNRCTPTQAGRCERLGVAADRNSYPIVTSCQSEHAEIRALAAWPYDVPPASAEIWGHPFACPSCETALRTAGVGAIHIVAEHWSDEPFYGIGLRPHLPAPSDCDPVA